MSKRVLFVVLLSSMIVAVAVDRPVASETKPRDLATPDVEQLLDFEVGELNLPRLQLDAQPFDVAVSIGGQPYVLNLEPYSLRSPDFKLLVDQGDGQLQEVQAPPPRTYRGAVAALPGARVAASLVDGRLWAKISFAEDDVWHIEPLSDLTGQPAPDAAHVTYRDQDVVPVDNFCGVVNPPRPIADIPPAGFGNGGVAGTGLVVAELACDADVEYYQENNSNVASTMIDIENVVNQMEEIYENDLDITYEVTAIVVRTAEPDPYTTSICDQLLPQVRQTWRTTPESAIKRDVVQLFTGKNLGGCLGIAYLGTVCESVATGFGYSVVESKAPFLPFSLRLALTAHELGHNWNAPHCCGSCGGCGGCRIMCPCIGGCSGIVTSFGSSAVTAMTNYRNAIMACLFDLPSPIVPPFFDDVPTNLIDADKWIWTKGGLASTNAVNEPSPPYSIHLDAVGGGTYQDDEIRSNFINLAGMGNDDVLVSYWTQHIDVEAGEELVVEYWAGLQWNHLNTVTSDGVDQAEFMFHEHDLTGLSPSPFFSEFRLRFRTEVSLSNDEWYIDDVSVGVLPPPANNDCSSAIAISDGVTPFSTIGATTDGFPAVCDGGAPNFDRDVWFSYTPSCSGPVSISMCNDADFDTLLAVYFPGGCPPSTPLACSDDAAGCGTTSSLEVELVKGIPYLIRVGGKDDATGTGNLTIACGAACPEDLDGDGNVAVGDLLELLALWGTDPGGPPDFDGDGNVGVSDLLQMLGAWGPC